MKSSFLTILLTALACLCGCSLFTKDPEPNVLAPDEEVRGWMLLWDGDDPTNGWVGVSAGCSNFTARGWSVTNGALVASAGADPIRTATSYRDFNLKVDYRLAPGASGRVLYDHNAETNVDTSAAYVLTPLPAEAKDPLAWQTIRIATRGKVVTHWLDGQRIESRTRGDANVEGRIVLAPGEGQVEFRNVKIRPTGKW